MKPQRIKPGPGQESVWDYPRPPRAELSAHHIQVLFNGITIADTHNAWRVLETSHPPAYYIPPQDVRTAYFTRVSSQTWCEWKGQATYYDIVCNGKRASRAAWTYDAPTAAFAPIAGYYAFYPALMDACFVDGEQVRSQAGDFYGGWITDAIVGPFKGEPGTWGW